ncbi:uncharacterized protein VTP21DRAFT_6124 [Calcarisporiella thermophila]|uniref:uncharacterized protein n=1 Tax=Calcarisporiella thermophila TaxID=911321 RepID=UPI003744591E
MSMNLFAEPPEDFAVHLTSRLFPRDQPAHPMQPYPSNAPREPASSLLPSPTEFDAAIQDYLDSLSPKKRDKAVLDRETYNQILSVLLEPRSTRVATAQFRFWAKRMFTLVVGGAGQTLVCHDDKPVAVREDLYEIMSRCHQMASHGGRDKTSALVRRQYSWIPKELIARFVRQCPHCNAKRSGGQRLPQSSHNQPSSPCSPISPSSTSGDTPPSSAILPTRERDPSLLMLFSPREPSRRLGDFKTISPTYEPPSAPLYLPMSDQTAEQDTLGMGLPDEMALDAAANEWWNISAVNDVFLTLPPHLFFSNSSSNFAALATPSKNLSSSGEESPRTPPSLTSSPTQSLPAATDPSIDSCTALATAGDTSMDLNYFWGGEFGRQADDLTDFDRVMMSSGGIF